MERFTPISPISPAIPSRLRSIASDSGHLFDGWTCRSWGSFHIPFLFDFRGGQQIPRIGLTGLTRIVARATGRRERSRLRWIMMDAVNRINRMGFIWASHCNSLGYVSGGLAESNGPSIIDQTDKGKTFFSSHISARIFQLGVGQCGNSLNHRSNISHFPSRYSCYPKFWRSKYLPRAPPLEIDSFSVDRSTSCSGLRRQHFDTSLSIDLTRSDWKLQGQWCGFEYAIKEDNRAWHVHFSLMFQFILDCSSPFFLFHFVSFWSSSPIKWH